MCCPFKRCCNPVPLGWHARPKPKAEQVGSIDVRRLGPRIGQLPPAVIAELDKALRLHLSL
jgi:mRNA interferase MazF